MTASKRRIRRTKIEPALGPANAIEALERRVVLSAVTGTVSYQYPLADGSAATVPLAGRVVYDDVNQTGSLVPSDPVAVTDLKGEYSLDVASGPQTISVLPRSGWVTPGGSAGSRAVTSGTTGADFTESMSDPVVINVLAAYTAAAANVYDLPGESVDATIASLFQFANRVEANSDTNVRLDLVATVASSYTESGSFSADLQRLATGGVPGITSDRKADGADLVVQFEGVDSQFSGNEIGLSYEFDRARPDPGRGEAIVGLLGSTAQDGDTLSHELGHLFGGDHDPAHATAAGTAPFARGYEFTGDDGVAYQDVMSYGSGTILPYYSTPAAFYAGQPLGLAGKGDNARAIRLDAPAVARYDITGNQGTTSADAAAVSAEDVVLTQAIVLENAGRGAIGGTTGTATISLSEAGVGTAGGQATVELEAADLNSQVAVTTRTVAIRLRVGQSKSIRVSFVWPESLIAGQVRLIASTIVNGIDAVSTAGTAYTAIATTSYSLPDVDLGLTALTTKTLAAGPGRRVNVPVRIGNGGNVPAVGSVGVAVTITDSTGVVVAAQSLADFLVRLKPGRSRPFGLAVPILLSLGAGSYLLSVRIAPVTSVPDTGTIDKLIRFQIRVV